MKKIIRAIALVLVLQTMGLSNETAYAGAGWLCDNYGHACLSPGGSCQSLVPPVHICDSAPDDESLFSSKESCRKDANGVEACCIVTHAGEKCCYTDQNGIKLGCKNFQ